MAIDALNNLRDSLVDAFGGDIHTAYGKYSSILSKPMVKDLLIEDQKNLGKKTKD